MVILMANGKRQNIPMASYIIRLSHYWASTSNKLSQRRFHWKKRFLACKILINDQIPWFNPHPYYARPATLAYRSLQAMVGSLVSIQTKPFACHSVLRNGTDTSTFLKVVYQIFWVAIKYNFSSFALAKKSSLLPHP